MSRSCTRILITVALAVIMGLTGSAGAMAAPSLHERGAIVVGGEPKYMVADAAGDTLYVSDTTGNDVAVVDVATGLVTRRFSVPDGPVGLALSADEQTLFVASYFGDAVYRIDVATGAHTATSTDVSAPWALLLIDVPGRGTLLAVTEHHADRVSFLDPGSLHRVAQLPTAYYPYQMDVDPVARRLYVVSYGGRSGGELMAVDLVTLTRLWVRATGGGSFDVQIDRERGNEIVTDLVGGTLTWVDSGGGVRQTKAVPGTPRGVRLSAAGDELYVADQANGLLQTFDPVSGIAQGSEAVGSRPGALTWLPGAESPLLVVANQGDGTLSLLSAGEPVHGFADVPPSHRFHREIRVLSLRGALGGYAQPDGTSVFHPDATLVRAQLAKVLVGSLGLHTEEVETAGTAFSDVPLTTGAYPYDYVVEAARLGIVTGIPGVPPRFKPYDTVTRVQLTRMVVRAAAAVGSPLAPASGGSPFADVASDNPDLPTILAAYKAGLISGVVGADGRLRFQPYAPATRGQTARVVFNLLGALR